MTTSGAKDCRFSFPWTAVAIISLSSLTFPCLSLLKPRTAPPDDLKTLQPKEAKRTEVEVILGAAFLRLTANPFKTL